MNRMDIKRKRLTLLAKLLGLVTMIVLARLIGDLGMAYLAGAMECFALLQLLFLSCVPDCVEKLVRSRAAKGQYKNITRVYRTALLYCIIAGIAGSLILFGAAGFLMRRMLHMQEAVLALQIFAPVFFLSALIAILQGYFQGIGTAMPTVIASIVKQIFCLAFAALFGYILYRYGEKVSALLHNDKFSNMYGAAGAALGFLCATFLALCFLFLVYLGAGRRAGKKYRDGMRLTENGTEICRLMLFSMAPSACLHFLFRADILLGLGFYQLNQTKGTDGLSLYGAYYGKYLVLTGLASLIILLLATGMDSAVISAVKKEEYKSARDCLGAGIQAIFLPGAFLAAADFVLAPQLMELIFGRGDGSSFAASCMQQGFLLILFLPMGIWFAGILAATGKRNTVLLNVLSAFLFYVLFVIIGLKTTEGNPIILVYAKLLTSVIFCVLCGFFLIRFLRYDPEWLRLFVLPTAACAVTGLCMFLLGKALTSLIGAPLTCIICIFCGGFCYLILILALKCIREKEFSMLPGGNILQSIGTFLHLI